jgi:glycosyltransferase involved in cell wall biosynthesis
MRTAASFIVGVPTETEDERRATLELAERLRPTTTWINVFVGLPDSPLYHYIQENDLVEYRDSRGILYPKGHDSFVDRFYGGEATAKIPRGPGQDPKLISLECRFDGERALPGDVSMPAELMTNVLTRQRFAERLALPGTRVLDVGCGSGWGAARFADLGCRVAALDIDPAALRYARANHNRPGLDYLAMDGAAIGIPDGGFDLVTAFELIEHMPREASRNFVYEAYRVLADGGWLVGTTPLAPGRKGRDHCRNPYHFHEYSLPEMEELLGFFDEVSFPRIGPYITFQARKISGCRPKVSVLMGVYNGEERVGATVASVLAQDFGDYELVIIDDGSTDGTAEVLARIDDECVRYYRQPHAGLTVALNRGLAAARGEYIARIDSGDKSYPERLKRQAAFLDANPEVVLVGSAFERIGPEDEILGNDAITTKDEEIKKQLPAGNQFMHGAVMFRAGPVREIGGYREFFRYSQDYDLWLRLMDKGGLANLPEVLSQWRVERSSITVSKSAEQKRLMELARKFYRQRLVDGFDDLELGKIETDLSGAPAPSKLSGRSDLANFHFQWGKSHLLAGQLRPARRQFYFGLRQNPVSVRLWLYFAVSNLTPGIVTGLRKLARGLRRIGVRLP